MAGAGVLGLTIAVLAARAGARVAVYDPRPLGANASGVAAGMLAPVLEAALDPGEADPALLMAGYRAWPAFAAALGVGEPPALRAGALHLGDEAELACVQARLQALGAPAERITAREAEALQPGLAAGGRAALRVRDDGRLDPADLLARLAERLHDLGGAVIAEPCPERVGGELVVAAGYASRRWAARAPALAALQPIKGHVLHFAAGPRTGPTLRTASGYAAPQPAGVVFGATMEPGRSDDALDAGTVAQLHASAVALLPDLAGAPHRPLTGVRAATHDGRPLAGPAGEGLHLACGARRNGWLLAPLIAQAVLAGLAGDSPSRS